MTPSRTLSRTVLLALVLLVAAGTLALAGTPAALGQKAPAPGQEAPAASPEVPPGATTAEVLEGAKPSDWRDLDPENTLYLTLPAGRVIIELAPDFAPKHVANVRGLARQHYYDGLAVVRSQENYVVQWGDPKAGEEGAKGFGEAARSLPAEWDRPIPAEAAAREAIGFTPLGGPDVYAPEAGFVGGMPAHRDVANGRMGLAHCYGMVGAGRGETQDSGSGAELYVVIGHSPRHLDRNVTLLGRVVQGMEHLSTLPRGTGNLGFYESPEEHVPITSIRLGSELPEAERANLQVLRTDTDTFRALIDARRWRREEWFLDKVGAVSLCNVPLPVREKPAA
jgi:peptidylprolyl isomerase